MRQTVLIALIVGVALASPLLSGPLPDQWAQLNSINMLTHGIEAERADRISYEDNKVIFTYSMISGEAMFEQKQLVDVSAGVMYLVQAGQCHTYPFPATTFDEYLKQLEVTDLGERIPGHRSLKVEDKTFEQHMIVFMDGDKVDKVQAFSDIAAGGFVATPTTEMIPTTDFTFDIPSICDGVKPLKSLNGASPLIGVPIINVEQVSE